LACQLVGLSLVSFLALRQQNHFLRYALVWCLLSILRICQW